MQPEQPEQAQPSSPQQPIPQPVTPPFVQPITAAPQVTQASNRKRTILALWLMIGPTALIIVTIALYAVANLLMTGTASAASPFSQPSVLQQIVNITLFLVGIVVIVTWLPGLITGIVLLATKKK